ncbi:MAG: hypothetical protein KJ706_08545 [Candidatus Omnitrophica bacterium]|nr:hypothetical protein [Candidatus Omnitrophota bacterium]MBU4589484.1 hypothetical protein [Candidatus Omnitrophota bacterium]
MKNWIVNNFWMKVFSLALAVLTWFYVNGELGKQGILQDNFYKPPTFDHTEDNLSAGNKGYVVEKK